MTAVSVPLSRLIRENFAILMTFAFSRTALARLLDAKFRGEWPLLQDALFVLPEQRAGRACLELATLLRILDDEERIGDYLKKTNGSSFGRVVKDGQSDEPLYLRDMTNKIVHAANLQWDFSAPDEPKLICISGDPKRWARAEVEMIPLAAFCGQLMSD